MQKINQQLKRQITEIIQRETDDPDLEFLSITAVRTTSDLQEAKVYYSLLNEEKYPKAKVALNKMKGFIRGALGKRVRLKVLPQLVFFPDESIRYSVDVYKKIEDIKEEDAQKRAQTDDWKD